MSDTNEVVEPLEGEQPLNLEDDPDALEDVDAAEGETEETEAPAVKPKRYFAMPDARAGGAPPWAKIPAGFKFPRGRQVAFLRFRAEWTDTPWKGDRQAVVWSLTDADEKIGLGRAMGDVNRAANELSKQMLRAIDGHEAVWDGTPGPGNVDRWWTEIGGKCRQILVRVYTQLHVLSEEERTDFFENCIEVRTTG